MLVSHRHRFIYTKTIKTGGTSVESYFEPLCMPEGLWTQVHHRRAYVSPDGIVGARGPNQPPDCQWWHHMPATMIRQKVGEEIWGRYYKFCVTAIRMTRRSRPFYFFRERALAGKMLSEPEPVQFETWLLRVGPPMDRDKFTIDGKFCLDDVVRYERLETELDRICQRLGVEWIPSRLPTFKVGVRPEKATAAWLYTDAARAIIRQAYAFELDYFGYDFPSEA